MTIFEVEVVIRRSGLRGRVSEGVLGGTLPVAGGYDDARERRHVGKR